MIKINGEQPPIAEQDWQSHDPDDLDERYSHHVYFGLTHAKFIEKIKTKSISEGCFELCYLPLVPLKYYVCMFIEFFQSDDFDLDKFLGFWELGCFLSVLENTAEEKKFLSDIWDNLQPLLKLIETDKRYTNHDEETYTEYMFQIERLKNLWVLEQTSL